MIVIAVLGDHGLAGHASPATLPPSALAPMSTITEPAAIALSASSVTSSGGLRPGTCAVVITTSCRAMCAGQLVLLGLPLLGGQLAGVAALAAPRCRRRSAR